MGSRSGPESEVMQQPLGIGIEDDDEDDGIGTAAVEAVGVARGEETEDEAGDEMTSGGGGGSIMWHPAADKSVLGGARCRDDDKGDGWAGGFMLRDKNENLLN